MQSLESRFKITKEQIRTHFNYNWWKYLVLVVGLFFFWNLLYTVTRYQSPENMKIEWYYEGTTTQAGETKIEEWLAQKWQDLFPDMEEVTFTTVGYDETYGDMQISVWAAAGQGDLYMVTKDRMESMGSGDSFADLQSYIDEGLLDVNGIDLSSGYVTNDENKTYLVGIPCETLTGLSQFDLDYKDKYICLLVTGGNIENTLKLVNAMISEMSQAQ